MIEAIGNRGDPMDALDLQNVCRFDESSLMGGTSYSSKEIVFKPLARRGWNIR